MLKTEVKYKVMLSCRSETIKCMYENRKSKNELNCIYRSIFNHTKKRLNQFTVFKCLCKYSYFCISVLCGRIILDKWSFQPHWLWSQNFILQYCTARCWPRVSAVCFTCDTDYLEMYTILYDLLFLLLNEYM